MTETRLSPAALLIIGALTLVVVIESRVVIDWIFGVAVSFWWTVAVGVVVYGAILFWGTLPAPEDGPDGNGSNDGPDGNGSNGGSDGNGSNGGSDGDSPGRAEP